MNENKDENENERSKVKLEAMIDKHTHRVDYFKPSHGELACGYRELLFACASDAKIGAARLLATSFLKS